MPEQTHGYGQGAKYLGEVALSPDGRFVAFVARWLEVLQHEERSGIFLQELDADGHVAGQPVLLTENFFRAIAPAWAPDSQRLLFLSNHQEEHAQVWLIDIQGQGAQQLTTLSHGVSEMAWSPDGRWIALTGLVNADEEEGVAPHLKVSGNVEAVSPPAEKFLHLFILPAPDTSEASVGVQPRRLTSGSCDYLQPCWAPDSKEIGVLRNRAEKQERSFLSDLWAIVPESGQARCLTNRNLEIECYSWAPDGRSVILVAGEEDAQAPSNLQRLYLVTRDGNVGDNTLLLTPEIDSAILTQAFRSLGTPGPYRPVWSADGQKVYFLIAEQQAVNVYAVEVVWRTLTRLTEQSLTHFLILLPGSQSLVLAQQYPGKCWNLYRLSLEASLSNEIEQLTDLCSENA